MKIQDCPIGPSTGWLSAKVTVDLDFHSALLSKVNATATEMVWNNNTRREAMLAGVIDESDLLDYRSLHLGGFSDFTHQLSVEQFLVLDDLKQICKQHNLSGTSLHPDSTPDHVYSLLSSYAIPVGIENMDRQKNVGQTVDDIAALMSKEKLPAVLDLQHAFEIAHDRKLNYLELIENFAKAMQAGEGIRHFHLSGEVIQNGQIVCNHAQLNESSNCDAVLEGLKVALKVFQSPVPIILEGDPLRDFDYQQLQGDESQKDNYEVRKRTAISNIKREIELIRAV